MMPAHAGKKIAVLGFAFKKVSNSGAATHRLALLHTVCLPYQPLSEQLPPPELPAKQKLPRLAGRTLETRGRRLPLTSAEPY